MLERRLEQMEALLQTSKSHDHHGGHFETPNPYHQIQVGVLPEFHRSAHSTGSYGAKDHSRYMSPDGAPVAHSHSDKKVYLDSDNNNHPMASTETPRSILCTPPSTVTRPSVGPMPNMAGRNEAPLSPATTRAPIDKEESILSPDNVLPPSI
jgi:hypothetical protein